MGVLIQPTEINGILQYFEGRNDINFVEAKSLMEDWADQLDVDELRFPEYLEKFNAYFKTKFNSTEYETIQFKNTSLNESLVSYCQKNKNIFKTSLLSGNDRHNVVAYNKYFKFDKWAYKTVYSYYYKVTKPDAKIYKIMLEKLHAEASECVFVDDFQRNVDAANKLGITPLHWSAINGY